MVRFSYLACSPARLFWLLLSLSSACGRGGNDAARQVGDAHTDPPDFHDETDAAIQEDPDAGLLDAEVLAPVPDSSANPDSPTTDAAVSPPEPEVEPDGSVALGKSMATRDSAYLFEPSLLRTFELFLHNKDLATLDADPAAELYVPGQLQFEGGLIPNVGIRYKGSVGSFLGCVSGGFPPKGAKTCVKLGMKVKLDFDTKGTRFFGQKKLQFHAMNLDRSLLRERFGYGLFNAVGVQAPRTAHVRLLINGKLVGVFLLVEVLDDPFMEDRFVEDKGAGNLYKEAWPVGSDEARYLAAIEASGTKPANATKIAAFARELAAADDVALPTVLARWIDLDYMARYVAVDRAIRHDDGPYHWYCGTAFKPDAWHMQRSYAGESCGNHNYYWYEEAKRDRLWLLPWDLDLSLSGVGAVTQIASRWNDLNADCTQLLPGGLGTQMPITCDPLQRGVALALGERVRATLRMLVAGPLSEEALEVTLAPWIAQLRPAVEEAHLAHESEQDTLSWSAQVEGLRAALRALREAAALDASAAPMLSSRRR